MKCPECGQTISAYDFEGLGDLDLAVLQKELSQSTDPSDKEFRTAILKELKVRQSKGEIKMKCNFCGKNCDPEELVDGTCLECLIDDCIDPDYEPPKKEQMK